LAIIGLLLRLFLKTALFDVPLYQFFSFSDLCLHGQNCTRMFRKRWRAPILDFETHAESMYVAVVAALYVDEKEAFSSIQVTVVEEFN